jgi:hypothetical protein
VLKSVPLAAVSHDQSLLRRGADSRIETSRYSARGQPHNVTVTYEHVLRERVRYDSSSIANYRDFFSYRACQESFELILNVVGVSGLRRDRFGFEQVISIFCPHKDARRDKHEHAIHAHRAT